MEIIREPAAMTAWSNHQAAQGRRVVLVPTMGCFHEGHVRLMETAAAHGDDVVVSLFVNPLQFGPNEDFERYPRVFEQDCAVAEAAGVSVLFAPERAACYPPDFQTTVRVSGLTEGLCGASRPGHFGGVTTVVAKLFNMVKPGAAVFGQKDFQQLAVIRAMVRDLNWDIEIIAHPIVREDDGLAMSSRNRYLSAGERRSARCLSRAIATARELVAGGLTDAGEIKRRLQASLTADSMVSVDYIEIVNDRTLRPQTSIGPDSVLALAVVIGTTRLIDNGYLVYDGS